MSTSSDISDWLKFFTLAGIPTKVGAQYARIFVDQRIQRSMLVDLDKTTLKEMGIIAIGDQISIMKQAKKTLDTDNERQMLYSIIDDETKVQQGKRADDGGVSPVKKAKITTPQEKILSNKRDRLAPDHDEIYRVKMPIGATAKTREILKKAADLKSKGLNGRGTSGIRQSGVPVASKTTVFARLGAAAGPETKVLTALSTRLEQRKGELISTRKRHASPEVTSTTTGEQIDDDDDNGQLGSKQTSLSSRLGRLSRNKPNLAPVRSIRRTVWTNSNSAAVTTTINKSSSRLAHAAMDREESAPIRSRLGITTTTLSDRLSTRTSTDTMNSTKRSGVFNRIG